MFYYTQESEGAQSSVPSDLYDYLEKMDMEEEETEEEVRDTGVASSSRDVVFLLAVVVAGKDVVV